jgi:hypothetical protein
MSDIPRDPRLPGDEDPVVHQYLMALPVFAPRRGLADRVLVRVRWPLPPAVRRIRDRGRELVESGRIWLIAAPFAAGALASLTAVVVATATYWSEVAAGMNWLLTVGGPAARDAVAAQLSMAWLEIAAGRAALGLSNLNLIAAGVAAAAFLVICAWGLYRTLHADAGMRIPFHAKR